MKIKFNERNTKDNQKSETQTKQVTEQSYITDSETGAQACPLPENHIPTSNLLCYRLYFSNDIKEVCRGDASCLIEETSANISAPKTNNTDTPYYWRVDTVLTTGEVMEGRVWSI